MQEIKLPVTRYYGSKRKLVKRIWDEILLKEITFETVLDVFGGSASFAYYAKAKNKTVIYNDIFKFNYLIGRALIENNSLELTLQEALNLLVPTFGITYQSIIEDNFHDIYYLDYENRIIDIIVQNIGRLDSENKKSSAFYLLFQCCLIKRPYNLFHRKNLNLRTNFQGGNFGNKVTWERSFEELFNRFYNELKDCTIDNDKINISMNQSALNCRVRVDLVYIDPPYFHKDNYVAYHSKYHFLEGLANYNNIVANINNATKHKEIQINKSKEFENKASFLTDLGKLIEMHPTSVIVISYRNNGIPTIDDITTLLYSYRNDVEAIDLGKYNYALNKNNIENSEFVIIAR